MKISKIRFLAVITVFYGFNTFASEQASIPAAASSSALLREDDIHDTEVLFEAFSLIKVDHLTQFKNEIREEKLKELRQQFETLVNGKTADPYWNAKLDILAKLLLFLDALQSSLQKANRILEFIKRPWHNQSLQIISEKVRILEEHLAEFHTELTHQGDICTKFSQEYEKFKGTQEGNSEDVQLGALKKELVVHLDLIAWAQKAYLMPGQETAEKVSKCILCFAKNYVSEAVRAQREKKDLNDRNDSLGREIADHITARDKLKKENSELQQQLDALKKKQLDKSDGNDNTMRNILAGIAITGAAATAGYATSAMQRDAELAQQTKLADDYLKEMNETKVNERRIRREFAEMRNKMEEELKQLREQLYGAREQVAKAAREREQAVEIQGKIQQELRQAQEEVRETKEQVEQTQREHEQKLQKAEQELVSLQMVNRMQAEDLARIRPNNRPKAPARNNQPNFNHPRIAKK